jgi:hypothetical protein
MQSTTMKEAKLELNGQIFIGNPHEKGWAEKAACGNTGDLLFVKGAAQNKIAIGCGGCAVQAACLRDAIETGDVWGIRGGLTERRRRALVNSMGGFANVLAEIDHERDKVIAQQIEQNNHPEEYAHFAVPLRLVAQHRLEQEAETQQAS